MYLQNKYTNWYNNIIAKAKLRVNQTGYTEKHHIIPKSLGGTNDDSNLVRLTPKEHFVCHLLLVKMTVGNDKRKMSNAIWGMAHLKNPYQSNRYKINSNIYSLIRKNYKRNRSSESIEKIRAKLKGRKLPPRTPEHSAKLGRYVRTDEHRRKISEFRKAQTGIQTRTEETKKLMSNWQKGVSKPKVSCEHCGKETSVMNKSRWHGDNCRFKFR